MPVFDGHRLQALYSAHHEELRRYAKRLTGCPETAEELVQDCFVRVMGAKTRTGPDNQRAYLFAVVSNLAKDYWRSRTLRQSTATEDRDLVDPGSPIKNLISSETLDLVRRAVRSLPPRQQEAFTLRRIEGLPVAQVATRMGLSIGTIEKHLTLALRRIDEYMRKTEAHQ